jgi:hypothetical protein
MQQDWRKGDPAIDHVSVGHISVKAVREHPQFPRARSILVDGLAGLYFDDRRLRSLIEYERGVMFMLIVSLDAAREPHDPSGGVTMRVLNDILPRMGIAPGRRIVDAVANLRRDGLLESTPALHDGRVRLMRATPRAILADCEWIRVFHSPLPILCPHVDYTPALVHDRAYQRAFRLAGLNTLAIADQIMSANSPMDFFVRETVGFRVLMVLMQFIRGRADNRTGAGFYSRAAQHAGVSRTYVKNVMVRAAERGYVTLSDRPGDYVEACPVLLEAFDRWVAESLSSIDRVRACSVEA